MSDGLPISIILINFQIHALCWMHPSLQCCSMLKFVYHWSFLGWTLWKEKVYYYTNALDVYCWVTLDNMLIHLLLNFAWVCLFGFGTESFLLCLMKLESWALFALLNLTFLESDFLFYFINMVLYMWVHCHGWFTNDTGDLDTA